MYLAFQTLDPYIFLKRPLKTLFEKGFWEVLKKQHLPVVEMTIPLFLKLVDWVSDSWTASHIGDPTDAWDTSTACLHVRYLG